MKDYNTILSRVRHLLKYYTKDYVKGYIYALLDWRVINLETSDRLEDFIKKGGLKLREKKWKAIKINKSTKEEIEIGRFYGRENAINAIGKARSVDLNDEYEYCIESKF